MSSDDVDQATATEEAPQGHRLNLDVDIQKTGPCKRHVKVKIARDDIEYYHDEAIRELLTSAAVPGFRPGRVPRKLVERKFKKEVGDQVKQKVLMESLERLGEDHNLDAISEPDFDASAISIPDDGDFSYEFDVEVRPEFELPDYSTLEIERPTREVSGDDVNQYRDRFLSQFGTLETVEEAAQPGEYISANIVCRHGDKILSRLEDQSIRLRPILRFHDAELTGFDQLMAGVKAGETRVGEVSVSLESPKVELRGEKVAVSIEVLAVKRMKYPELTPEFLERLGSSTPEELDETIRGIIERQVTYGQRQRTRQQVIEKMTESGSWELPESLVRRQVDNALRREILEMQQAGFTDTQIRAREGELRQRSVSSTHQALKEHLVLDKVARAEKIEVQEGDLDMEIYQMAMQRGESPRKMRARLEKQGLMENLVAQVTERKAVDVILGKVKFRDVPMAWDNPDEVEAISQSVGGSDAPTKAVELEEPAE